MAGLPNVTGKFVTERNLPSPSNTDLGVFSKMDSAALTGKVVGIDGNWQGLPLIFDASDSNPIYGNSETVTPLSESCRFYIRY